MRPRALEAAIVLLALIPSARLAWNSRDMPHLGLYDDDGLYWVSAKSLAQNSAYRILSLPRQPCQTKYPPLYPWVLSWAWRINPNFPENMPLATLFAWLMLPPFLLLSWLLYSEMGFGRLHRLVLCVALAVNPNVVLSSVTLMSDLMFGWLVLGSLILAERATKQAANAPPAAAAGILGGLAYLTRTAALPLLITAPLCFLLQRQYKRAALFLGAMLPPVLGWTLWARSHLVPSTDLVSLYYTDYAGYHFHQFGWKDIPSLVCWNARNMLSDIGDLFVVHMGESLWGDAVLPIIAILSLAGIVHLARRSGSKQYPLFAAGTIAMLLFWHGPHFGRFLLSLFPLLLAGFSLVALRGLGALHDAIRRSGSVTSLLGSVTLAGVVTGIAAGLLLAFGATWHSLPGIVAGYRSARDANLPVYRWISQNLPDQAAFLVQADAVLYLYTGRRGCHYPIPLKPLYQNDRDGMLGPYRSLASFARKQHLTYVLLTKGDFGLLPAQERELAFEIVRGSPAFHLIHEGPLASVYRIQDQ